jgi:hypothetical protein
MAKKSCPSWQQPHGQGRRGFDPTIKDHGWTKEELDVICANCNQRFGAHTGSKPSFHCPASEEELGEFRLPPPPPAAIAEGVTPEELERLKAGATYNSGKCPYSTSDGHAEIVGFGHYDGMKFNICATHWPFYKDSKNSSGKYLYRCELYPPTH